MAVKTEMGDTAKIDEIENQKQNSVVEVKQIIENFSNI